MSECVEPPVSRKPEVRELCPYVVYVGRACLPPRDATDTRMLGVSLGLMESGFNVIVLSEGLDSRGAVVTVAERNGCSLRLEPVCSANLCARSRARRLVNLLFGGGTDAVRWIARQKVPPTCVIHYGSRCAAAERVTRWCRAHRVPVVADVVEHHEWWQFPLGGFLSPFFLDHLLYRRTLRRSFDALLCISDWLTERYRHYDIPRAVVRTTLDTAAIAHRDSGKQSSGGIALGYAGSSNGGTKDLLRVVIDAVLRCNADGIKVTLDLAGVTGVELRHLLPRGRHRPDPIRPLGRLEREEAMALIRRCDFMPLLRRDSMYAWAGFPTKVAESMALGTPVVVNPVGDVAKIVVDGVNGLYCESPDAQCLSAVLRHAAELTDSQVAAMRRSARDTAVREFDYRQSSATLRMLMAEVVSRRG